MLVELRQIVAARLGRSALPAVQAVVQPGPGCPPADVLDMAQALCQGAATFLRDDARTVAQKGADALIRFVAGLPAHLADAVRRVPAQTSPACKAWIEPQLNAYVSLGCTVNEVWAHLIGPESGVDDGVARALLWHGPRTVLDFGCGGGHFAQLMAEAGAEVDGLDIDPVKIAFFQFRSRLYSLQSRMRVGRQRETYDMVMALNVLDHLQDPRPALDLFRSCLPPSHVLCTVAAFPHDGWHQSQRELVVDCGQRLWQDFTLSAIDEGLPPWMDCWVRRPLGQPAPSLDPATVPRLNPGSTLHHGDAGGATLYANRFYSQPLLLDPDSAATCLHFDGQQSVAQIAQRAEVDVEDLLCLCETLMTTGHLYVP
ncbi:class I SAM-dependent methyltransferase [Ideonella sp.]|uniref:class I SAM-dependent methyltransferase n=1 Tax=Ideonella sp. TaxID=1929293 RepID=UPI0035B41BF6